MVYDAEDNRLKHQIVRMENTLARKSTKFSVIQQRLFYITLASIRQGMANAYEVEIDKEEVFELLGIQGWTDRHQWLKKQMKQMVYNSYIEFISSEEEYIAGTLFYNIRSTRKKVYIAINAIYLPLLQQLSGNYTRMLCDDVITFTHKSAMMLYQTLMRLHLYHDRGVQLTTKDLKEIFGLAEDDYTRKDGSFNRDQFEKQTIRVAVDEINEKSRCIKNLTWGKLHMVNGKSRRIAGYVFKFDWDDPRAVRQALNNAEHPAPDPEPKYLDEEPEPIYPEANTEHHTLTEEEEERLRAEIAEQLRGD